jgi:hypothetical protein
VESNTNTTTPPAVDARRDKHGVMTEQGLALLATRPYRTFWEWFARQRCRDDAVGELARDMWRDPGREDRNFTALSLADYLRDTWGKTTELDGLMAVHAQAVTEYEAHLTARTHNKVWLVFRQHNPGARTFVCAVTTEDDLAKVLHACAVADPAGVYTATPYMRQTYRCHTGEHEWWDMPSADRCCRPNWRRISVFPDRPLPEHYDREYGTVTDPTGWCWVWVQQKGAGA